MVSENQPPTECTHHTPTNVDALMMLGSGAF